VSQGFDCPHYAENNFLTYTSVIYRFGGNKVKDAGGDILMSAGASQKSTGGSVMIKSGPSLSSDSGDIQLFTDNSAGGVTGSINISTGVAHYGDSGNLTISTGHSTYNSGGGNTIQLEVGKCNGKLGGDINMIAGSSDGKRKYESIFCKSPLFFNIAYYSTHQISLSTYQTTPIQDDRTKYVCKTFGLIVSPLFFIHEKKKKTHSHPHYIHTSCWR